MLYLHISWCTKLSFPLHFVFNTTEELTLNAVALEFLDSQVEVSSVTFDGLSIFTFNALGFGSDIASWTMGNMIVAAGLHTIIVNVASAVAGAQIDVKVSAVPVPAALFLFAPALLGFLGLRRKSALAVAS